MVPEETVTKANGAILRRGYRDIETAWQTVSTFLYSADHDRAANRTVK